MRIAAIVDRLIDQVPGFDGRVLAALEGGVPKAYPAAYVFQTAERSDPSETYPRIEQRVGARFAVEIMVKHAGQAATGGPAKDALEDLRDAVKAALRGWAPSTDYMPIEHAEGRLMGFDAGMATWRDEFTTAFYERNG